jgi:3-oxoacyl-[acyl-carrier protein] reductase
VSGRRFLITGGSRGLGLAFCRHYLAAGHSVFTCARSSTPDLDALRHAHEDRLAFSELDLAEADASRRVVEEAVARLGGVDVLVNNAAAGQDALLAHLSDDDIARIVGLNVTATIRLTRQVVRRMLLHGGGVILNVSSICAARGYSGLSVYSATKGALDAFTRSLARELGASSIRVNAVSPGFFDSEMSSVLAPSQVESIRRHTPTGALATPEQVVRACDALVAQDGNITGQVLAVDGGASIA